MSSSSHCWGLNPSRCHWPNCHRAARTSSAAKHSTAGAAGRSLGRTRYALVGLVAGAAWARRRWSTSGWMGWRPRLPRHAARVFGWSFYSQGAGGAAGVGRSVIWPALRWFGDPDPGAGHPWDKGERLAGLVRRERTLLILDGLEPLQFPPGEHGR